MTCMFNVTYYCLQNFRDKCIKIYGLDPAHFCSAKKKKKTEVQLESLTNIDMLLMVEEQIKAGIRQAIYRYAKANTK